MPTDLFSVCADKPRFESFTRYMLRKERARGTRHKSVAGRKVGKDRKGSAVSASCRSECEAYL